MSRVARDPKESADTAPGHSLAPRPSPQMLRQLPRLQTAVLIEQAWDAKLRVSRLRGPAAPGMGMWWAADDILAALAELKVRLTGRISSGDDGMHNAAPITHNNDTTSLTFESRSPVLPRSSQPLVA